MPTVQVDADLRLISLLCMAHNKEMESILGGHMTGHMRGHMEGHMACL